VPAGKLEDEVPEVCAARELEEEAGCRAGRLAQLGSIWTTPGFTDEVIHLFAAFELERVPMRHEADEVIETLEVSLRHALDLVWSGELRDAKSALALLYAARHLGVLG
jgi:ADP-ribose pyrophosphatase